MKWRFFTYRLVFKYMHYVHAPFQLNRWLKPFKYRLPKHYDIHTFQIRTAHKPLVGVAPASLTESLRFRSSLHVTIILAVIELLAFAHFFSSVLQWNFLMYSLLVGLSRHSSRNTPERSIGMAGAYDQHP